MFSREQQKYQPGDDMRFEVERDGAMQWIVVRMGAQGYTPQDISALRQLVAKQSESL
jgi:hypothetical protein